MIESDFRDGRNPERRKIETEKAIRGEKNVDGWKKKEN